MPAHMTSEYVRPNGRGWRGAGTTGSIFVGGGTDGCDGTGPGCFGDGAATFFGAGGAGIFGFGPEASQR